MFHKWWSIYPISSGDTSWYCIISPNARRHQLSCNSGVHRNHGQEILCRIHHRLGGRNQLYRDWLAVHTMSCFMFSLFAVQSEENTTWTGATILRRDVQYDTASHSPRLDYSTGHPLPAFRAHVVPWTMLGKCLRESMAWGGTVLEAIAGAWGGPGPALVPANFKSCTSARSTHDVRCGCGFYGTSVGDKLAAKMLTNKNLAKFNLRCPFCAFVVVKE